MQRFAWIVGFSAAAALVSGGAAQAQSVAPAVGSPTSADSTIVEGAGVKVGEGTVMHPVVGAETGFINNVFYQHDNVLNAGLLRVLVEVNFASTSVQRLEDTSGDPNSEGDTAQEVGDLQWHGGLRIVGEEYLSGNDNVGAQHNVALGAALHGLVFPKRTWQFAFDDDYVRANRPTNYESRGQLSRDINRLKLQLNYAPWERALSGSLRYENTIDVFERANDAFANRIQHTIGLRANWQWLPITKIFFDGTLGFFGGLGTSSTKVSSMPLRTVLGIQTAITVNTTINARVGYGNGFYSSGENFSNPIFGVQFGWRYSPFGRFSALYSYDFSDSIQANYFRDHMFQASITQQYDKVTLVGAADIRLRGYRNVVLPPDAMNVPLTRDDVIFGALAGARFNFKDWLAATADYALTVDATDFSYMTDGNTVLPSYVRHQIMAGARAAW